MKNIIYFLLLSIFVFNGCSRIKVLKNLGANRTLMQKSIEKNDYLFQRLKQDIENNVINPGVMKSDILSRYGKPVLEKDGCKTWLYRLSLDFFENEKIYLYFDSNNGLISWEIVSEK